MNIFDKINEKKILIAAHRGYNGGNIPCNSLEGYQIAAKYGADIIEVDVTTSKDGELYMLHPGMEKHHFSKDITLPNCTKQEISEVMLANQDRTITQYNIATFDQMLETLKPYSCLINVDKFWSNPALISKKINDHGMADRIIVKSSIKDADVSFLEEVAGNLNFMAITWTKDAHEILKNTKLNYIGLELLFHTDDAEVLDPEFIKTVKTDGKILWGNSIVYSYKANISAEHTDDNALLVDPNLGWGWFAEKGFDVIQSDWCTELALYLKEKGYRK
jgi:glycerophosphoryl diester phosphodiesterase